MRPRCPLRRVLLCGAALFAASGGIPPAAAQSVRGTLVEDGSGRPLAGAVMVLLDAAGQPVARTFTRDDGRFFVAAPGPGRYSLRSQRIGFRSTTTPIIALAADDVREVRVEAQTIPVELATVRSTAGKRCVSRPVENGALFAIWDEARKALDATELTQAQRLLRVALVRYERDLDPVSLRVRREQRTEHTGVSENPFVSRPPGELSELGYVRDSAESRVYIAPDARVLLSDLFGVDHCFRVYDGRAEPGLIGLAFEPVRQRRVPDIAGVLWLDQFTAELRSLDYRYVGASLPTGSVVWGGRIEFQRMPAGTWIVRRWWIRMPVPVTFVGAANTQAVVPGQAPESRVRTVVRAVREVGGEVTSVDAPAGAARARAGVVAGTIIDSTRGAPLVGARVMLAGTEATTVTDADGRFRLMGLLEGTYALDVMHPRLDSLGAAVGARDVVVRYGGEAEVALAVPPLRAILAAQCPDSTLGPGRVALRGSVRTATGEPVARAVVSAAWKELDSAAAGRGRSVTKRADVLVDDSGAYRICGVPAEAVVRLSALGGALASQTTEHRPGAGMLAVHDLVALPKQAMADAGRSRRGVDTLPTAQVVASPSGPPGFDARRRHSAGYFLTREDIERQQASRVTDLLRGVPGLRVELQNGEYIVRSQRSTATGEFLRDVPAIDRRTATAATQSSSGSRSASRTSSAQPMESPRPATDCRLAVVIDGHAMEQTTEIDQLVRPDEIEAIEVYRGAAEVPPQYQPSRAGCGAVVIWTRRGAGGS